MSKFRYQVRLAIGTHFFKFFFFVLPFYVGLKVWAYFASMLIGLVFGYLYLFIVFKCRQRFRRKLVLVAMGSASFLYIISALLFQKGMYLVNEAWQWNFAKSRGILFAASFFGWLLICALFQTLVYIEQRQLKKKGDHTYGGENDEEEEPHLFEDHCDAPFEEGLETIHEQEESENGLGLEESLLDEDDERISFVRHSRRTELRSFRGRERLTFWYQSGYFDPNAGDALQESARSADGSPDESINPADAFKTFVAMEDCVEDIKWYHRIWCILPFKPAWSIFTMTCGEIFGCCCRKDTSFRERPMWKKIVISLYRFLVVVLNLLAIYVALVACVATTQIKGTKALLPVVHEKIYKHMDEGAVCAFDRKGGDIRQFESQEEAHLANYTIAHCGECGHCSTCTDLELEWSTRNNLAARAQKCGTKTLGKGISALKDCLAGPAIGWTDQCAQCWAEDIVCTKKHCMFIYLQSKMTNQVGNFKVSADSITSATCEEAYCEAGPSGYFVPCVGANRRRMNITSSIARPGAQRCTIVGVPDWEEFFYTKN